MLKVNFEMSIDWWKIKKTIAYSYKSILLNWTITKNSILPNWTITKEGLRGFLS